MRTQAKKRDTQAERKRAERAVGVGKHLTQVTGPHLGRTGLYSVIKGTRRTWWAIETEKNGTAEGRKDKRWKAKQSTTTGFCLSFFIRNKDTRRG